MMTLAFFSCVFFLFVGTVLLLRILSLRPKASLYSSLWRRRHHQSRRLSTSFFSSTTIKMDPTCVFRRRFRSVSLAVLLFFGCLLFGRRNPSHHSSSQSQSLTVCRPFSKPSKNVVNRFEFSAPHYYDFVSHSKNTKSRAKKDAKTAEMYFESEKPRGTTTTSRIRATPKIEEGSTSIFVLVEGRV